MFTFGVMLRIHFIAFLAVPYSFSVSAQELLFTGLSNEIQLPSQECYKIVQDKKGYIWFSTDNGLCRYGNNQLLVFDHKNGLPEKSVFNIAEDRNGKIWFLTSENRILYYDGKQELKEAHFSEEYRKYAKGIWAHPIPFFLDVSDPEEFFIANHYYTVGIRTATSEVRLISQTDPKTGTEFLKKEGHPFIPSHTTQLKQNNSITIKLKNRNKTKNIHLSNLPKERYLQWNTPTCFSETTDFIGIGNRILRINSNLDHTIYEFPDRVLNVYIDKSNGLWVGIQNNGVYYYPDINTMELAHHSLRNYSVTGICEDNELGIWCSTLEKGIFYSKNKYLISYASIKGLDKLTKLLKYTEGKLFASSSGDRLFSFDKKELEQYYYPYGNFILSDIVRKNNHWYLSGRELIIRTNEQLKSPEKLVQNDDAPVGVLQLATGDNNRIFGSNHRCVEEITDQKQIIHVKCELEYVSKTILYTGNNNFLLGGDQGVYEFNVLTLKSRKLEGIPGKVLKMIRTGSGRIWIITKNDGIFWMDGEKIIDANKILPLKTSWFYDITEDINGTIWAGSNSGLYRFSPTGNGYTTSVYVTSHGLPSNEIYKIATTPSHIWFSTYEGLFNLPLDQKYINQYPPSIYLHKLTVNNKAKTSSDFIRLPHDQNNFRFAFDVLTFKNGSKTKLEYELHYDNKTTVTQLNGNEILLENLSPNKYILSVYAVNNDGVKSLNPEVFHIEIQPPFWQTLWFMSLCALAVLIITFLFIRMIISRINQRKEVQVHINKLIAEYQMTALQAQMNPHFIFNAINTIQGYILENNEQEAYDYLAKFSKLIRMVLHQSQEKTLSVSKEIELLKLYIELEQMRFDHCFSYQLKLDENMNEEHIFIPPMLIQPYIENAIWHGLVNLRKSRKGKLMVSMEVNGNLLKVTIEDNGVGRKKAMEYRKNQTHKSIGMQLTGKRLETLNQLHGYEKLNVVISDLFNEKNAASGTKVEIWIPITIEDD